MLTIFHNPRCSKSREACVLAQAFADEHGLSLQIVEYLKTPPSQEALTALHQALQAHAPTSVRDMVRVNEAPYAELQLAQADDAQLLAAMASHPILLQRPIIQFGGKAVIARPPERAHTILRL
ncbi:arsenate reductase family protein [uncultured Oxalicibacterium sp.]|uniref:arsenate reductase family protein n=1 Tax=uncultured Oxalicibacterium sp. TaxID=1168540 RepID=UPI0025CBBE34|nr:arsenate reductase family protein [uncultured Oxalicibacterium sp.]